MGGKGRCRVGTSGWQYRHWRGPFYPAGLATAKWLAYYAARFDTVEVNATFYHLPREGTAAAWRAVAPPGFLYAVKASRYITHMRRLKEPARGLEMFFERLRGLGDRMGPVLFQLPPRFPRDAGLLEDFLRALPEGVRPVFEFRDERWLCEPVYTLLAGRNAALCIYELGGRHSPVLATADFAYVRLHGPHERYAGDYGPAALRTWAERMRAWTENGLDAFCYFDNDQAGYAPKNAAELKALLEGG